jgi:acetyl esterase/lipase
MTAARPFRMRPLSARLLAVALIVGVSPHSFSQPPSEPLALWPEGKMPGLALVPDAVKPGQEKNAVTNPTISVYPAPESPKPAPAVLICPGGGYDHLAIDKEGVEIAKWAAENLRPMRA